MLPLALEWGLVEEVFDFQLPQWSALFSTKGIQDVALLERLSTTDLAICWLRDAEHLIERNLLAAGVKRCIIAPGRPPEGESMHIVDYLASTIFGHLPNAGNGSVHPAQHVARGRMVGARGHVGIPLAGIRGWGRDASTRQSSIAIHPGSGGRQKCWPVEKFAAVIEELWRRGWPVLLVMGPADEEQRAYLQRHLGLPAPGMLELLDNAPLLEVARRLQQCRCYLGNDSGITHLAALLGLPTIALFGPSDPITWKPFGERVRVIYEPSLDDMPVGTVVERVEQALYD